MISGFNLKYITAFNMRHGHDTVLFKQENMITVNTSVGSLIFHQRPGQYPEPQVRQPTTPMVHTQHSYNCISLSP